MRSYAIGDVHGHLDKLRAAHALIAADRAACGDDAAPVIHIGDLPDRGPDTHGVIDWLIAAGARDPRIVVLRGNHDRMFGLFLSDPRAQDPGLKPRYRWLDDELGGARTLASYGVEGAQDRPLDEVHAAALAAVPAAHRAFLAACPLALLWGQALFVHAGLRPGIDLRGQSEDDMLWIRQGFLDDPRDHGALVVHGHTALERATHYGNRLNIDSGAGYGRALSAVVIEGRTAWLLTPDGRQALEAAP